MASAVTRSQPNRAPSGCDNWRFSAVVCNQQLGGMSDDNMDQHLEGMFPAPCWIHAMKISGCSVGKGRSYPVLDRCTQYGFESMLLYVIIFIFPSFPLQVMTSVIDDGTMQVLFPGMSKELKCERGGSVKDSTRLCWSYIMINSSIKVYTHKVNTCSQMRRCTFSQTPFDSKQICLRNSEWIEHVSSV